MFSNSVSIYVQFFLIVDPESKTTRLSLCCAVTESSSHTPPHSNHFQTTQLGSRTCDDDGHVVQTRDCESQTVDSNPGWNE